MATLTELRNHVRSGDISIVGSRGNSLLKRLQLVKENIHDLEGVNLANGKLHIHRLEKDVPEKARPFSASLYRMLPRIRK